MIGFALWDASLINYANGTSVKLKLYTEDPKYQKIKCGLLSDEKIEKQKAKVEK